MKSPFTESEISRKLSEILEYDFRVSTAEATHTQIYKALSKIVVNYLKENYHQKILLSQCAKQLNISYDYFHVYVRKGYYR